MNKKNAHLFLPLVQALIDGKELQCLYLGTWKDIEGEAHFGGIPSEYRIKPQPEVYYRIYRDTAPWRTYEMEKEACTMLADFKQNHPQFTWTMKVFKEVLSDES